MFNTLCTLLSPLYTCFKTVMEKKKSDCIVLKVKDYSKIRLAVETYGAQGKWDLNMFENSQNYTLGSGIFMGSGRRCKKMVSVAPPGSSLLPSPTMRFQPSKTNHDAPTTVFRCFDVADCPSWATKR